MLLVVVVKDGPTGYRLIILQLSKMTHTVLSFVNCSLTLVLFVAVNAEYFTYIVVVVYLILLFLDSVRCLLLDERHTFHYVNCFVFEKILACLGVSNVSVDFFEFLSTEVAPCLKPSSRHDYSEVSYPRMQQCYQVCRKNDAFTFSAMLSTYIVY